MLGPPKRDIPNLPARGTVAAYVTEAQARGAPTAPSLRPSRRRSPPTGSETSGEELEIAGSSAYVRSDAASRQPSSRPVRGARGRAHDPLVLVCADDVETIRELLPALEQALQTGRPLVVVAPAIAQDVLGTLEVNAIQGKVPGVAVLADDAVRRRSSKRAGPSPIDGTDLRSGWLDPQALGHVARWTSTRSAAGSCARPASSAAE